MAPRLMGTPRTEAQKVWTIRRPLPYIPAPSPIRALKRVHSRSYAQWVPGLYSSVHSRDTTAQWMEAKHPAIKLIIAQAGTL
jgi:hypothetical protein